jgi:hypothetical protein
VLNYKLLIKLSRVTSSTAQTEESATKMAILVRGRWGIRRWTASPIGRLVTKLHKYVLPSIFLHEDKQTSINNVTSAEQIEKSTITENPTVENLILLVMPKAQNRHPTKSSSVLQVLECKKVSSLTSKGRNIYYMDRYQQK